VYRLCIASFDPETLEQGDLRCWERSAKTISNLKALVDAFDKLHMAPAWRLRKDLPSIVCAHRDQNLSPMTAN
jgi:hypothetical protein